MKERNYDDILDLPTPEPKLHRRMSREKRAVQFMPFAALTGYEEEIRQEAARNEEEMLKKSGKSIDNRDEAL